MPPFESWALLGSSAVFSLHMNFRVSAGHHLPSQETPHARADGFNRQSSLQHHISNALVNSVERGDKMHWSLLTALALVAPSTALIRFGCSQLTVQRVDPLVNPGISPSPHLHQIIGGVRLLPLFLDDTWSGD